MRTYLRPLWTALLLAAFCVPGAWAMNVDFASSGDTDILTFILDGQGDVSVRRSGRQEITVTAGENLGGTRTVAGRLVESVSPTATGAVIRLKTDAFGYISTVVGPGRTQVQIFRDPIGTRWKSREELAAAAAEARPAPAPQPAPVPAPEPDPAPAPPPQPASERAPAPVAEPEPAAQPAPVPEPVPEPEPAPQPEPDNATIAEPVTRPETRPLGEIGAAKVDGDSLFSVPYSVRVNLDGAPYEVEVDKSERVGTDAEGRGQYRAVTEEPEAVRDVAATVEEATVQQDPVTAQVTDPVNTPEPAAQPEPVTQSTPDAAARPAPAPEPVVAPEQPVAEPQNSPRLFPKLVRIALDKPEPEPVPAPVAMTNNPLNPDGVTMEDLARVKDPAVKKAMADAAGIQLEDVEAAEEQMERNATATQEDVGGDSLIGGIDTTGMTPEEIKRIEALQLMMLKAQSQVATGKLADARIAFADILNQVDVPQKIREEALYSLAGVLMTIYKDNPQEHYEEIQRLWKEALNANTRSPNIPTALMNLGLINLWVGNIPEAQGYFDILVAEHPYDENVPAIGYYWGEYAFRNGDWEGAADKLQNFIENYPEKERLARQAAFLLTEALNNLGLFEQSFQIIDYIDKRWPQAYEGNPEFLKLAGDVEYQLGMNDRAKDHYWTYYNMNPKAELSDVVLARIGDLYLAEGRQRAAKEIYERTINDYPDMEGGLVAKMRLAEEGIHDEPDFVEMVTVFNRPYTLMPKDVYIEIIDEHPDSPLAPLALLKLGMWHFFQKEYPEALAAAQRLLTEYPRSNLVERAEELGDQAFSLAVPLLIEQQNYQLVTDYWERYDFIEKLAEGDANATRIGVAHSYAQLDAYGTALDLIKPFLQPEQVVDHSEAALALAADIYLEQNAWSRIDKLAEMVRRNWDVTPRADRLLRHANAVALENLGETERAMRLWGELGADEDVEEFIRADAMYFLAKQAMDRNDLKRTFVFSQEAISLFLASKGDTEKIKDCMLMSIYATERSGRYQEALKWALEYDRYVPRDDPEWSSGRYKLAQIYQKAGALAKWREILEEIVAIEPESLYGRLSKTALKTAVLEEKARDIAPRAN